MLAAALGCAAPAQDGPPTESPVPAWSSEMVWYQIFPERFRNGDPSNDPDRASLPDLERVPASWALTDWGSDWYARAEWEREMSDDFYRTVRTRRYGGDLQGVIDQMDYLQGLGVNGIYFNPLFWGRSEHKYDGNTYHHIDPYFGPDPEGDFALMETETSDPETWKMTAADSLFFVMVDAAHARGIRVIIDGVFNHTGREFFAFKDLYDNQQESPYKDWFTVLEWDDPATPENEFDWQGWWGHRPLPELTDTPDGTDLHPGPKAYVFDSTRRWMDPDGDGDPSDGVDGWRLDVVADVPNGFWADWNAHVRSINPEAYTVAELWEDAARTLEEGGFSASMNYYGFAFPVKGFLIDGQMPAADFAAALDARREAHPEDRAHAMQNLIDSHDTERVVSMIASARRQLPYAREDWEIWWDYDWGDKGTPAADPGYPIGAPTPTDRQIQRLVALFQMTYVGSPMVYYGTEAGMWAGDDPDDRQPMWWPDIEFDRLTHHPRGLEAPDAEIGFDTALHGFYREVIALRRSHPALQKGSMRFLSARDGAIAFVREADDEAVVVVINRSGEPSEITLEGASIPLNAGEGLYEVFSTDGAAGLAATDASVTITLPPLTGAAFIRTGTE